MPNCIKIVPERVKEEAEKVRMCSEAYNDIIDRLTNLVLNLADIWEGQAYDSFVSNYKPMRTELSKFSKLLIEYANVMDDVSDRMENTDFHLSNKIDSLS